MSETELKSIKIDLDVYKVIVMKQKHFDESPNDVLRRLLDLPPINEIGEPIFEPGRKKEALRRPTKRLPLPDGLQLHKTYKGLEVHAVTKDQKVIVKEVKDADGKVVVEGGTYNSPSAAACKISQSRANGWKFWKYKNTKTGKWELLKYLYDRD